jgi:hypothetical protein
VGTGGGAGSTGGGSARGGSAGGDSAGGDSAGPAAAAAASATGGRIGDRTSSGDGGAGDSDMFVDQKMSPRVKFYIRIAFSLSESSHIDR